MERKESRNPKLRLTIRLSHNGLSFAVGDPKVDGQMIYEPYDINGSISLSANLREAFEKSELLRSGYKSTMVLVDSPVILIPTEEYDEKQAASLYRYSVSGHDKDDIARAEIPDLNAVAVFAINHDVRVVISDHFQSINFLPVILPVWQHLYHKSFTGSRQKLFAYFHDKNMNIFRFDHGRFRYANSFACDHAHDALYYILYVWKMLGMNNNDDELYIAGDIPHADWLTVNMKKYLQRSFVIDASSDFNQNEMAKRSDIPYDIKSLYL